MEIAYNIWLTLILVTFIAWGLSYFISIGTSNKNKETAKLYDQALTVVSYLLLLLVTYSIGMVLVLIWI
jgi:hypothetical protein